MSDLPLGWTLQRLGDAGRLFARRVDSFAGTRPYLATSDVHQGNATPSEEFTYSGRPVRADLLLKPDDVLQAKMKATDKAFLVREAQSGWLASTGFALFNPQSVGNSSRFFLHLLSSRRFLEAKDARCVGSTQQAISDKELAEIGFAFPPRAEQEEIANVLDALQGAIQETETIIAKLTAVRQGLLHDLLTRGIDANGELRPTQNEAPHLYKESVLGWIPKDWDVGQLSELLGDVDPAMRSGPFGSALLKQELVESGLPLLGIDNVHTERFVADYSRFVTPRKFAQLSRYAVRPGDLMITIMGTVGRCCLVPDDVGQALSSKHTWTISLNSQAYSPYLAMLQVNYSPWVLGHFARDQQGGTMAAIRSETLRSTRLPAPPRDEQRLIEERLREVSKRIDLEVKALVKRHSEKAGLMDDLLTGRVRVTPLLAAEQQGCA